VSGAGIDPQNDEAREVPTDLIAVALTVLVPPKGRREQCGGFRSCQVAFARLGILGLLNRDSGLIIMQLRQRWGSMKPGGQLILNRALIRASVDAIDYVITHELCHMRHNHHGPAFFELLDRVMPDWEKRKLRLECQLA